jgi:hypothetical protein
LQSFSPARALLRVAVVLAVLASQLVSTEAALGPRATKDEQTLYCMLAVKAGFATSLYDCYTHLNVRRPFQICINDDEQSLDDPIPGSCVHLKDFESVVERLSSAFFSEGVASLFSAPTCEPATSSPATPSPATSGPVPTRPAAAGPVPTGPATTRPATAMCAPCTAAPPASLAVPLEHWAESQDPLSRLIGISGCDAVAEVAYWMSMFVLYVLHCGFTAVLLFAARKCLPRLRRRYPSPRWGLVTFGGTLGLALDSAINRVFGPPLPPTEYRRRPSVTNAAAEEEEDEIWMPMSARIREATPPHTVSFRGGPEPRINFGNHTTKCGVSVAMFAAS